MIYSDEKGDQLPGNEECQMGSTVRKVQYTEGIGGVWNEKDECQINAEENRGDWGAPILVKEHWNGGMECGMKLRSANAGRGAPMGINDCYPSGGVRTWGVGKEVRNAM